MTEIISFFKRIKLRKYKKSIKAIESFALSLNELKEIENEIFIDKITQLLFSHFQPDICRFYSYSVRNNELELKSILPKDYSSPKGIEIIKKSTSRGAIGYAFNDRQIKILNSKKIKIKENYINIDNQISSEIIIPMIYNNIVVGEIVIDFYRRIKYAEKKLYTIIGSLLNNILHNHNESINKEKRLDFIISLPENLKKGFDETIQLFYKLIDDIFSVKFISFWTTETIADEDFFTLRSFYPKSINSKNILLDDFDSRILSSNNSISGELLQKKAPILFEDLINCDAFQNKNFAKKFDINWCFSFPVIINDKLYGVMNYTSMISCEEIVKNPILKEKLTQNLTFYFKLIELIEKLSTSKNSELFLQNNNFIYSSLMKFSDEQESWDNIAELVSEIMNCEACSIFLKSDDGDELILKGSTGIIDDPKYELIKYAKGEGLTGQVLENGQTVLYYNEIQNSIKKSHISKYREKLKSPGKSKSIIMAPLKTANEKIIGVVRCNNVKQKLGFFNDRFTNEDISKLNIICNQIVSAFLSSESLRKTTEERERNVYSLHHELLSPVIGIRNHSEWFQSHIENNEIENWDIKKIKLKFVDIERNAELLSVLVSSMGNLDNITLEIRNTIILDILKTCKMFLIEELNRNEIKLDWSFIDVPKIFRGDQIHLMRVFFNLFRNSIKYCDDSEIKKYIKIETVNESDKLIFRISDNGIGIIKEEKDSIFNRHTRGTNASLHYPEGTGIGLTYCKKIVEQHNGKIFVSNCSKPTVFQFNLSKKL